MYRLFQFIYNYRTFFTFLIVEIFCLFIIIRKNEYHNSIFYGTTNRLVGSMVASKDYVSDFFNQREINKELLTENARLKRELSILKIGLYDLHYNDSIDSEVINQYNFIKAEVIDNTVGFSRNYITLDKGSNDGVQEEMGVVGPQGIVGKIKSVSNHYSVASSILHQDVLTSAAIKKNNAFGSLKWISGNLYEAKLLYIPRHITLNIGDSIVTSGFNALYPRGVFIGEIKAFELLDESAFYDITVNLATDFSKLSFVYIIQNKLKNEVDSISSSINVVE